MTALDLLSKNYVPKSNGEATEKPSSFTDVFSAGFQSTRDNYNTNSASRLIAELEESRAEEYTQLTGKKLMPDNYSKAEKAQQFTQVQDGPFSNMFRISALFNATNQEELDAKTKRDKTYLNAHIAELKEQDPVKFQNLMTDDEIMSKARETAVMSGEEFDAVSSRASESSRFWGGIAGSMGGALTDPINIVTLPLGAGAGGSILRAVGIEAGIQAGVEAATQPQVMKWQKEIGKEYDLGDATENVMLAAALGGAFAGVARGARPTAQVTFALMQNSKTFSAAQKKAAAAMSRYAHFKEAEPNPKVNDTLHTESVDAINKVVREGGSTSTVELPMKEEQFNAVDTTNTRGLTQIQKNTLSDIESFQQKALEAKQLPQDKILVTEEGFDFKGRSRFSSSDIFANDPEMPPSEILKQAKDLVDNGKFLELEPMQVPVEKIVPAQKAIKSSEFNAEAKPAVDSLLIKSGDKYHVVEGHGDIASNIAKGESSVLSRVIDADRLVGDKAPIDDVPSLPESSVAPRSVEQVDADLKTFESNEFTRASDNLFDQTVETNPKFEVELDDGQVVTLKQLKESLEDDQKLLDEISTCAIG